ncbi:AAA domain-containing protein [Nocardia tenerifensis]|uniref:AAA domain-containing protein n=1 Tax=Nocardia tenerifensis TaxID=228006 RepID=A0A318JSZ3_9NOCA|nr:AAA family ATPase [Nocardia tenerifensis]PXX59646.1 AAA domain-containing protein [Nocardia tenerifensis]
MTSDLDRRWIGLDILSDVLGQFEADPGLLHRTCWIPGEGGVAFFPVPGERKLHVLGSCGVAAECRRLLADSVVDGWGLQSGLDGATPLQRMKTEFQRLTGTTREFNMLMRAGFTTVEQLAATPEECLYSLPNSGDVTVARIREFLTWWRDPIPPEAAEMSTAAKALLRESARKLDSCCVLAICGFPASGKSVAARFVASIADVSVLDKDNFAPTLEQTVMTRLVGEPFDRDSEDYKTLVSPGIYEGMVGVGFTIARKHSIVLDAPFLSVIQQAAQANMPLSDYLRRLAGIRVSTPVMTVWMDSSAAEIRSRMVARGEARDAAKLAEWDNYQSSVLDSGLRETARSVVDLVVPN